MELSSFDSEIPMTAALDRQAIRSSSLILGKRLFMLTLNVPIPDKVKKLS